MHSTVCTMHSKNIQCEQWSDVVSGVKCQWTGLSPSSLPSPRVNEWMSHIAPASQKWSVRLHYLNSLHQQLFLTCLLQVCSPHIPPSQEPFCSPGSLWGQGPQLLGSLNPRCLAQCLDHAEALTGCLLSWKWFDLMNPQLNPQMGVVCAFVEYTWGSWGLIWEEGSADELREYFRSCFQVDLL